jgi:hypothetical protein
LEVNEIFEKTIAIISKTKWPTIIHYYPIGPRFGSLQLKCGIVHNSLAGEGYDFCPILLQFLAWKLIHSP